jgi:hypothetical protein
MIPGIENKSLHKISNDNMGSSVNTATLKILLSKAEYYIAAYIKITRLLVRYYKDDHISMV